MLQRSLVLALLVAVALPLWSAACSGQKVEEPGQVAEQAAPPPSDRSAAEPPPAQAPAPPARQPARTQSRAPQAIPEERPRRLAPPPEGPQTISVTIPSGTSLSLAMGAGLSSENAAIGDPVDATLKNPLIVGERVVFPAGSRVEGKVTDVKSAKRGFKDTGGALAVSFERIVAPDGRQAAIDAAFTKLAEGSGKKKAAIIGGSAAGAAILGRMLGKDTLGSAVVGGAVGTAVAGGTKGREAVIKPDEGITVALERSAQTTVKR